MEVSCNSRQVFHPNACKGKLQHRFLPASVENLLLFVHKLTYQ